MKIFSPMKKAAFLFARALIAFALVLLASGVQAQRPVDSADLRTKINQWVITNGAKQITATQINNLFNGVADLMTQYSFDSAYRINDTLFLAGPKLSTFKITLKPGSVTAVSGTANRITSTGGSTPAIDISATFEALLGKVANRIDQNNALTTSLQLSGVISDETGSGPLVFSVSPTFTGTPLVPTAAPGTNTTQIASTAFVTAAVAAGGGGGGAADVVTTITSGTSSTVPNGTNIIRFNSTTLLTYTLTLPTTWHSSNDLLIAFTANGTIGNGGAMVTLTIVNGSGQTLSNAVAITGTTFLAGEVVRYHLISTIDQRTN